MAAAITNGVLEALKGAVFANGGTCGRKFFKGAKVCRPSVGRALEATAVPPGAFQRAYQNQEYCCQCATGLPKPYKAQ